MKVATYFKNKIMKRLVMYIIERFCEKTYLTYIIRAKFVNTPIIATIFIVMSQLPMEPALTGRVLLEKYIISYFLECREISPAINIIVYRKGTIGPKSTKVLKEITIVVY